jgi:hypothetical protein
VISVKNGLNLDFSGSGLPDHRFSFVKKLFFLISTHPGLIYCEKPQQQFFGVLQNKGATWPNNGHFRAPTGGVKP